MATDRIQVMDGIQKGILLLFWGLWGVAGGVGIFNGTAEARPRIPLAAGAEPPEWLSQTGVFGDKVAELKPGPGFQSYEVNQPLFSDFARKDRIFYVPEQEQVGFAPEGPYTFPVGTIFVKHFRMEISRGVFQNLETRVLVRQEDPAVPFRKGTPRQNWKGFTYLWQVREGQDQDARLVDATSSPQIDLDVDASAPGGARSHQPFKIPNRRHCLDCHHESIGFVRGFETYQINRVGKSGREQLEEWNDQELFNRDIGAAQNWGRYSAIEDESVPLEHRVRSYLAVNCSHCHNPDPTANCASVGLDFRFSGWTIDSLLKSGRLVPGEKDHSMLYNRMNSLQPKFRMPQIGVALKDSTAIEVVGRWIDQIVENH